MPFYCLLDKDDGDDDDDDDETVCAACDRVCVSYCTALHRTATSYLKPPNAAGVRDPTQWLHWYGWVVLVLVHFDVNKIFPLFCNLNALAVWCPCNASET